MKPLSTLWLQDADPDKKQSTEDVIRNSSIALSILLQIVKRWEQELTRSELTLADLEKPNWEVRQAYRLGDKNRLRMVKELLSFIDKGD